MIELTPTTTHVAPTEANHRACRPTRKIYDAVAPFYSVSTLLFHSYAHREALSASSIQNGMRVLELGMGSGEMFRRLVRANPDGHTVGVDLSPKMAARSQEHARRLFPDVSLNCQAADARYLPFASGSFDSAVCCYLFELLPQEDVPNTLSELRRVIRPGGRLTVTLAAQNGKTFNAGYRVCSKISPAFWGRQVDGYVLKTMAEHGFKIKSDMHLRQIFYRSRVVSAVRAS